tara:strand:+ start:311 stop:1759 length:1449 start_codon:yes stop_codon:yes gene_type:complete
MATYDSIKYKSTVITNLNDTGTTGSKLATGTTAQRGSTSGAFRLNTTTGLAEYYNGTDHKIIDNPPTLTSVSPTEVDSGAGGNVTFTIVGTNFGSGAVIKFIANDASVITADTTTVNSATSITAVEAVSSFANAKEPYDVKIESVSGLSATLDNQINVDATPTWTTASGGLGTVYEDVAMSTITVEATDADGDSVAYSVQSGTLPTGTVLGSANGQITGTPNVSDTYASGGVTHSFDLRATAGGKTADRAFTILRKWQDGSTAAGALASAVAIKSLTSTTTDAGYYIIDPSDSSNAIFTYCNMSFDGGGWVLVHSAQSATWDGQSGDQSYNNYYDSSHFAEYTSGVPHDVYSKLRTNFPFTQILVEWSTNSDMSSPTDARRPVYETGSVNGLINLSANSTLSRKSGNTGALPTTNYSFVGSYDATKLYYKNSPSSDDRSFVWSNYTNSWQNQGGFYGWSGQHNSWAFVASDGGAATVSFYVK